MKVKVLRGVRLESGKDVFPGEEIELSEQEAKVLAQRGAVQLPEAKAPDPAQGEEGAAP